VFPKPLYTINFKERLEKHRSLKKEVENKINRILLAPLSGEPLKGNLDGLRSVPVKRNFILIYAYCKDCRSRNCQTINACPGCKELADETIIFHTLAPHDKAYEIMTKIRK